MSIGNGLAKQVMANIPWKVFSEVDIEKMSFISKVCGASVAAIEKDNYLYLVRFTSENTIEYKEINLDSAQECTNPRYLDMNMSQIENHKYNMQYDIYAIQYDNISYIEMKNKNYAKGQLTFRCLAIIW